MVAAAAKTSRDVKEIMGYINPNPPPGGGILTKMDATPEEYKKHRRLMVENKEVQFLDARTALPGGLAAWKLDTHGFTVIDPPPFDDFLDRKRVRAEYYPKLEAHAKKLTGAQEGYCFLFATRDENPMHPGNAYSRFAHTDASADTPPLWRRALKNRWGVPAEEADSCDILMVNYWFPRDRPAYKDPLCLLDGSTVDLRTELSKIAYVDGKGGTTESYVEDDTAIVARLVGPTFSPRHRWVFISDQEPHEGWIFKQYDTRDHSGTKMAFHNSFHDPFHDDKPKATHGRRSVEFRVLLTFPKEPASRL